MRLRVRCLRMYAELRAMSNHDNNIDRYPYSKPSGSTPSWNNRRTDRGKWPVQLHPSLSLGKHFDYFQATVTLDRAGTVYVLSVKNVDESGGFISEVSTNVSCKYVRWVTTGKVGADLFVCLGKGE